MRARGRVMGTRCSARAPAGAAGRGAGARTLAGGRLPRKSTTSDLVSLPSRPEAGIAAGSRRFSSISRRTAGLSLPESRPPSASAAGAPGFAPDAAAAAVAFGATTPPSSMRARTWPLVTTAPLGTRISRTTPLAGAGTSSTTLSVSRSARFSSRRMGSPGCLCHATSVASATDSGSWGTRISVVMSAFSSAQRALRPRGSPRGPPSRQARSVASFRARIPRSWWTRGPRPRASAARSRESWASRSPGPPPAHGRRTAPGGAPSRAPADDHARGAPAGEILERGYRRLVTQETLRRHDDQRLAEGLAHLPPQHVEHLRRRRRHAHLHVVLRAQLQEALEARRGMLGPGPLVAVRQQQREAAETLPLGLARADELVDDDLGAVGEVAVLRLPDHERLRIGGRVAVLESHHRLFGQHGIDHLHARLPLGDVLQRDPGGIGVLIVQHRVSMEEGSARAVLARQAHAAALLHQRRVRERLGAPPVEGLLALEHPAAIGDELRHARVQAELFRIARDALAER